MIKEKNKITGYLITNGEVRFVNYRNKVFKKVMVKDIIDKFKNEIEDMASLV